MDVDIITGKEVTRGYKVKEDAIIRFLRWLKMKTGSYQGNNLYVAEESLEEYKKKRKAFENYVLVGTVFIVIIFTFSVLSPLISGDINRAISMFFASLGLSFLIIFLILFSYMPAIEDKLTVIEKEKRQEEEGQEVEKKEMEVKEEVKEKEELREEEVEEGVKEEKEMVLAKETEKKAEREKIEKKVEKPKKVKKKGEKKMSKVRKAKKKE
jgi:hypothetical protein